MTFAVRYSGPSSNNQIQDCDLTTMIHDRDFMTVITNPDHVHNHYLAWQGVLPGHNSMGMVPVYYSLRILLLSFK